jgi:hypothetical protein
MEVREVMFLEQNAKGRKKRLKEFWHFGQYVGKLKICFRVS